MPEIELCTCDFCQADMQVENELTNIPDEDEDYLDDARGVWGEPITN